jgi:hypothetical protein
MLGLHPPSENWGLIPLPAYWGLTPPFERWGSSPLPENRRLTHLPTCCGLKLCALLQAFF